MDYLSGEGGEKKDGGWVSEKAVGKRAWKREGKRGDGAKEGSWCLWGQEVGDGAKENEGEGEEWMMAGWKRERMGVADRGGRGYAGVGADCE